MDKLQALFGSSKNERIKKLRTQYTVSDSHKMKKYREWINGIKYQISKQLYKMAYLDIGRNAKLYSSYEEITEILWLKIQLMLKIIKRKMQKYELESSSINLGYLSSIQQWLNEVDETLDMLSYHVLPEQNPNIISNFALIEKIFHFYIEYFYLNALFYKRINQIEKTCAYLGIGIGIIAEILCIITNPKTLNIIEKIYLLVVSVFINNRDYINALIYQEKVIDYCFRELVIRIDYYQGVTDHTVEKKKVDRYNSIFQNVSIAFCQRGICQESIGKITKSNNAYKQSKWFAEKFLQELNASYCKFINSLVTRSIVYHEVIEKLIRLQKAKEYKMCSKPVEKLNNKIENSSVSRIAKGHYINFKKYKKAEEFISNLKGEEIDVPQSKRRTRNCNEKSIERSNSNYLLNSLRLLGAYKSDSFKDTLYEMKKINIAFFDLETKERLQKVINKITSQNDKFTESNCSSMKNLSDNNQKIMTLSQSTTSNVQKQKNVSVLSEQSNKKAVTCRSKLANTNYDRIEKFDYNPKYFSKGFKIKKRYLDKLDVKEMAFHKNLLTLKTNEKYPSRIVPTVSIEDQALYTFNRLKDSASRNKNIVLQTNPTNREKKEMQTEMMLENTVIKSFNPKILDKLNERLEKKRRCSSIKKEISINEDKYKTREMIDKHNNETIKHINEDILKFKSHSKSPNRSLSRNSFLKRSITDEFGIQKKKKREFDLERFISK